MHLVADITKIRNTITGMEKYCQTLDNYGMAIGELKSRFYGSGNMSGVVQVLGEIEDDVVNERYTLSDMCSKLSTVATTYEYHETMAASSIADDGSLIEGEGLWSWSDTWDMINEAGIFGSVTSAIGRIATGEGKPKDWVDALKDLVGGAGKVAAGMADKTETSWLKCLFGLNKVKNQKLGEFFGDEFINSLKFKGVKSKAELAEVGTKWGGHFLTLLGNAFENAEECKGDVGRGIMETAVETGVDIAVGSAASALGGYAVTAIGAAFGATVGAPAVLVGIAGVGIAWGANWVCKQFSGGRDLGEVTADFVCDTVMPGIKSVATKGKEVVSAAIDKGKEAISSVWDSCKDAISTKWAKGIFAFG